MIINDFLDAVEKIQKTGNATEHSYRSAIEGLFSSLDDEIQALNEPKRVRCGAPDFIIQRKDIVIGHVEAKDLDVGLRKMNQANTDQFKRYTKALPNLVYTNCLDWDFYRDGELVASVTIADLLMGIQRRPDDFERLEALLSQFITQRPLTITSPVDLAERMAGKAGLIKDVLFRTLKDDEDHNEELGQQFEAFKTNLIHDITEEDFADVYAETIAYGMFAARLHDPTLHTFSRQEALELLPKSNPFLRKLFQYIAGYDLDTRLTWIVDDLALVFLACDLEALLTNFGKSTHQTDPFLHFYETFLAAYNPAKRKARGVWYTPQPVVNFIVRAVDEVLQTEFGLVDGLADTSKVRVKMDTGQRAETKKGTFTKDGKNAFIEKDIHRVQILDPATGTGTFLAEVIRQIAPKIQDVAPGMWSSYIENDLIPRLHGFELLMASYAMCHLKLDRILTEMGYQPSKNPPRLSVFLTNALEEGEPANQTLPFTQWLTDEAKGANEIKSDLPIMCVIGNPPYLGEGGVSEGWLGKLMDDYKVEPGGKVKLKERNPKWINDLYVKFIRMSSHLIQKNGEGVLGFITNHGYLDNPTFRGMRWHLLKTFDKIWILDLHGNSKKKEVSPDGTADKNVFDIQQGVSIIIAVKKRGTRKGLADVMHADLWGSRKNKYELLELASTRGKMFEKLIVPGPQHAFLKRDYKSKMKFDSYIDLHELMPLSGVGICSKRDKIAYQKNWVELAEILEDFVTLEEEKIKLKYAVARESRDQKISLAKSDLLENGVDESRKLDTTYRPFDTRVTYYSGKVRGFLAYPVSQITRNFAEGRNNIGLVTSRQGQVVGSMPWNLCFVSKQATDLNVFYRGGGQTYPLYIYPDQQDLDQSMRINLCPKIFGKIQNIVEKPEAERASELDIFDYIYGVLHCPEYRKTFAEFLKIDFPRIPWPKSPDEFWSVSEKGTELRKLHLMEPEAIGQTLFPFDGEGDALVEKPEFKNGQVWINKTHHFDAVPEIAWNFYIGGYQPAQKWLKDRKGRELSFDDVRHYQKIIKILSETDRIMKTIEMDLS